MVWVFLFVGVLLSCVCVFVWFWFCFVVGFFFAAVFDLSDLKSIIELEFKFCACVFSLL